MVSLNGTCIPLPLLRSLSKRQAFDFTLIQLWLTMSIIIYRYERRQQCQKGQPQQTNSLGDHTPLQIFYQAPSGRATGQALL